MDRFGVKRLLLFGVLCNIVNAAILIQTDTVLMLIIAQLIAGVAFLLHVVASQAFISRLPMVMIADLTDPNQSGLAMGLRFTAILLAGLLSPILLGFIIETVGLSPAFYVAALVVVLVGIRMLIFRPDLIPGRRR